MADLGIVIKTKFVYENIRIIKINLYFRFIQFELKENKKLENSLIKLTEWKKLLVLVIII